MSELEPDPSDRLWPTPTLARRDGGWSWLAWRGDGVDEVWASTSDELEAVIAAARAGATRAELARVIDDDGESIDDLVDAGILARRIAPSPAAATSEAGDAVRHDHAVDRAAVLDAFGLGHGDTEVALLDALDVAVPPPPVLDGLEVSRERPPEAAPSPAPAPIVADVVLPGGPPPRTPHAIALAPVPDLPGVRWLALDDLRVSIVFDRLALRSRELDAAILPRLPRAVRAGDPAILRLLAALDGAGGSAGVRFPDRRIPVAFPVGSEWLELKLYTSRRQTDRVLALLVTPLVAAARAAGAVDDWHFLRYSDPRWHVRLRLHGAPGALVGDVLPRAIDTAASWLADGTVVDLQVGSYGREVARYGGAEGVPIAERVFTADSECVAAICAGLSADVDGEDARWRIAALGIRQLVADLVGPDDVPAVLAAMRDDFARRMGRVARAAIADDFAARLARSSDLDHARAELATRSARIAPLAAALHALEASGRLSRSATAITASFVHMFTNRLLRAFALEQELVLYDLLSRVSEW